MIKTALLAYHLFFPVQGVECYYYTPHFDSQGVIVCYDMRGAVPHRDIFLYGGRKYHI